MLKSHGGARFIIQIIIVVAMLLTLLINLPETTTQNISISTGFMGFDVVFHALYLIFRYTQADGCIVLTAISSLLMSIFSLSFLLFIFI